VIRKASLLGFLGAGRVWSNALMWKEFNFGAGGKSGMVFKFLLFGGVAAGLGYFFPSPMQA